MLAYIYATSLLLGSTRLFALLLLLMLAGLSGIYYHSEADNQLANAALAALYALLGLFGSMIASAALLAHWLRLPSGLSLRHSALLMLIALGCIFVSIRFKYR